LKDYQLAQLLVLDLTLVLVKQQVSLKVQLMSQMMEQKTVH